MRKLRELLELIFLAKDLYEFFDWLINLIGKSI